MHRHILLHMTKKPDSIITRHQRTTNFDRRSELD